MPNTVIYHIQKGDTLSDIAQKLGINDWHKLRDFHNAHSTHKVTERIYAGKTLTTPNKAEVAKMNGTSKENSPETTKPKEKKPEKKKEKKEKSEGAKSEHSGKYFVVHNATCVCNKAENPSQTAKLQVTTHKLVIFNNQQGKFAATEEDKQFNPPTATFGKCTLKPSSGGNLPCQVATAPKWAKSYNKTKVLGKNILTEISTLQCTIGGKISVKNHGQSNTVTKEHSDNTNKAELAMVNPGVAIPANKKEFPSASSITINKIENRTSFIPITSSKEEKSPILLRKNELCSFTAKLSEGNSALVSWLVYDGLSGDVSKKILLFEQIGVNFKNAFPKIGSYRVEGFGKPKTDEFESGKYNKNYLDCSLDFEVIVNKLSGTELIASGAFQKGVPISFEAPFLIEPNFEELQRLLIYATDGGGNLILDGGNQVGNKYTFTPKNSGAKYSILAEYKDDEGKTQVLKVSGETAKAAEPVIPSVPSPVPSTPSKPNIPSNTPSPSVPSAPPVEQNVVLSISHSDEVVRPETPLTFTAKTRNANKLDQIKWNLNGKQIGTGITINVPPVLIIEPGKYVIEAYIVSANAYGPGAKKEQDDWHFEVKKNDVVSFSTSSGTFKLGKKLTLTADKFIFKNLAPGEQIAWQVQGGESFSNVKSIEITPKTLGYLNVSCKINNNPGVTFGREVKQATVNAIDFTDANGVKIKRASWGQKVNISISQTDLENENIEVIVSDDKNTVLKTIKVDKFKSEAIPFVLDNDIKSKTNEITSLNIKIKCVDLDLLFGDLIFPSTYKLEIGDVKEIYNAIFSSDESGKTKISKVNYNNVSFFYGNTRGIKKTEKLFLQLYNIDPNSTEPLLTFSGIAVDDSGIIKQKINWSDIKDKLQLQTIYAVVRENDNKGKVLYFSKGDFSKAVLTIIKESELPNRPENTTPAKVDPPPVPKEKTGNCNEKYCVKKGDKSELIRELNIRLAGFGGNVPTDEFTDRTEKMIKQFQKDFMKVPETGKVCGDLLRAVDTYQSAYPLNFKQIRCKCGTCEGFGKGRAASSYQVGDDEAHRKFEYPGIHRSVLSAYRASLFYTNRDKGITGLQTYMISSGYRCHDHPQYKKTHTTNHCGKALDILYSRTNGSESKNPGDVVKMRTDIFIKYLNAGVDWVGPKDIFNLESTRMGAGSWVHVDVREFSQKYLTKNYFVKSNVDFNGKSTVQLAKDLGFEKTCSCFEGATPTKVEPQKPPTTTTNKKYKWAHSAFGNMIADKESNNNYNICNRTKGGYKVIRNIVVVNTLLKDIVAKHKSRELFAVGRYQVIPTTLNGAVSSLGLDLNKKMDEEMQDKIFDEYLISIKRPPIIKYLEKNGSVESAMYSAAQEWASIGVQKGKKLNNGNIAKGGESFYAGDGLNVAHITPEQIKNALIKSKNEK
jgi:muramidase (phage lysozyme)